MGDFISIWTGVQENRTGIAVEKYARGEAAGET
jgi:hypothetical protein